ncbi:uncharacterized protein BDR25DRAFT_237784, partial [Lindgomyces ingoldianus]
FKKRLLELKARRVKAIDSKRHKNNTYNKAIHLFKAVREVIQSPTILPESCYNIDKTGTGVMPSMLGSIQILVGKDDIQLHRGAGVKQTTVTAIKCVSGNSRSC